MNNNKKTKAQLIAELEYLSERITLYEDSESGNNNSAEMQRESQQLLTDIQRFGNIGTLTLDLFNGKLIWSEQLYKIHGLEIKQKTPSMESYFEFIHPDDKDSYKKSINAAVKKGTPYTIDYRIFRENDGEERWIHSDGRIEKNDKGTPNRLIAIFQDITGRKKADEELRDKEACLRSVVNESPFAIFLTDANGTLQWANPALKRFLNLNDEQLVGKYNVLEDILLEKQGLSPLIRSVFEDGKTIKFNCDWDGNDIPSLDLKGSNYVSIDATMFPIYNRRGELTNVVTNWIDITEQKKAEEARKKSETDLSNALKIAKMGHWEYDVRGNQFIFTDEFYSLYHTTAEEMGGYTMSPEKYIELFVYPDDIAKISPDPDEIEETFEEILERNDVYGQVYNDMIEHRIFYADGSIGYVAAYTRIIKDENGQILKSIGVNQDITERKRAEEAMKKSESDLSNALKIAKMGHWEFDVLENQFTFTDEFYSLYHTTAEEMGGYTMTPEKYAQLFVHPDDFATVFVDTDNIETLPEVLQNNNIDGQTYDHVLEHRMFYADGSPGYVEVHIHIIKDEDGRVLKSIGVNQDITERKRAEEALKKSESDLSTALQIAKMGHWEYDILNNQFTFTDEFYSMYRTTAEEMGGYTMSREKYTKHFVPPEDIIAVTNEIKTGNEIEGNINNNIIEHRMLYADGDIGYVEVHIKGITDKNGQLIKSIGVNQDITEHKKAELALRESLELYRTLTECISDIVISISLDGKIDYCSPAVQEIGGYDPDDVVGKHFSEYIADETDIMNLQDLLEKIIKTKKPALFTFLYKPKNDSPFYMEGTANPIIINDNVETVQCVIRDITERKQLEEEQAKASKLESIGLLAGGIAHDFNNILASILGNTSLAKSKIDSNGEEYVLLTETENAIIRATKLTRQLLTFAKGGAPVKEVAELSELIKETAEFSLRGSNVHFRDIIAPNLLNAEIDKGQIGQVIGNLVINAKQAMPHGGTVYITAKNVEVSSQDNLPINDGNYIRITVADNGNGIPAEQLSKIFDPYFTTKEFGSGLGLATCYSIISRHDGFIDVESKIGVGTKFTIYLPSSEKKVKTKIEPKIEAKHRTGKILVMEDDKSIIKFVEIMLKNSGNEVSIAGDGVDAIDQYKKAMKSGKPFDVVIMDLTIPGGMGGEATIKKLLEIDPKAKAIVSSGYANDPVISNFDTYGFVDYISKPYKYAELKKVLNNVLAK